MTTLQKALVAATLAVSVGTGIHEARRASRLQGQAQSLALQQDALVKQLQQEREEAANELAGAQRQSGQPTGDGAEVLKLRAEPARLRGAGRELAQLKATVAFREKDPTELAMRSWLDRVKKLNEKLDKMPGLQIPELQFLTDQDWLNAVRDAGQLETDADFGQALNALRTAAKNEFAGMVQGALRSYAQANNGQSPSDMSQLRPYFASSVDDSVLQRYEMTQPGTVTELATPLDDQDNKYYQVSVNTINSSSRDETTLQPAVEAFSAANNGQAPTDPNQLLPYVKTPEEQTALQKLMQSPAAK